MHKLRNRAPALTALFTLFLAVSACDEILGTNSEDDTPGNDSALVGSWVAVSGLITDATNPANTFDMITDGEGFLTVSFNENGAVVTQEYDPEDGSMGGDSGTWTTDGGLLIFDWSSETELDTVSYQRTGGHIVVDAGTEDMDFDNDGVDEVGNLVFTFASAADSPDADLVGTWEASGMVFTSLDNPSDSVDVIQAGVTFTLTISGDGTYEMAMTEPSDSGPVESTELGIYTSLEGLLWVVPNADRLLLLEYSVNGDTATFFHARNEEFDFNDDGMDEPATMTIHLTRQ